MQTMELRGKDVLVLGLGRSGMAAASLLQRDGAHVVVRDDATDDLLQERAIRLRRLGVRVELGNHYDRSEHFDLAVLSPGIAPERPIVREVLTQRTPLLGELELAYRFCLCPIVAITGTNGKTTTTELIAAMFTGCGKRTVAAGNIGHAFSDAVEATRAGAFDFLEKLRVDGRIRRGESIHFLEPATGGHGGDQRRGVAEAATHGRSDQSAPHHL